MNRRRLRALLLVLCTLSASACGIDAQPSPTVIESAALPPEQAPAEAEEEDAPDATVVYLVNGERLQPVNRSHRTSVAAAVEALLEGPRDTELTLGLRSAIPAGTELLGSSIVGDEIRLDLSEDFTSIVGEEYLLALGQLVFTATATGLVERVSISIEGTPVPVSRADGQLSTGAVTQEDYAALAPA